MKNLIANLSTRRRNIIISAIILCIILTTGGMTALYYSKHPFARKIKAKVKQTFFLTKYHTVAEETTGIGSIQKIEVYENNKLSKKVNIDLNKDVKKIYYNNNTQRLVNYPDGYSVDLPTDYKWSFNYSPIYVKASKGTDEITITREWSPYEDIDQYIDFYLNRFITSDEYRKANNITLVEDGTKKFGNNEGKIIKVKINDLDNSKNDQYIFFTPDSVFKESFVFDLKEFKKNIIHLKMI